MCITRLRYSPPCRLIALGSSLPLLVFFIATTGLRAGALVVVSATVIWLGCSVAAGAMLTSLIPRKLKLNSRRSNSPSEMVRNRQSS
jgi:hypothetical protein